MNINQTHAIKHYMRKIWGNNDV